MTTTALSGLDIALSGPSQKRSRLRQLFDHMVAARQREANRRIAATKRPGLVVTTFRASTPAIGVKTLIQRARSRVAILREETAIEGGPVGPPFS